MRLLLGDPALAGESLRLAFQRHRIPAAQAFESSLAGQDSRRPQGVADLGEDRSAGVQRLPGAFEVALVPEQAGAGRVRQG
jgi:hypothetical protein